MSRKFHTLLIHPSSFYRARGQNRNLSDLRRISMYQPFLLIVCFTKASFLRHLQMRFRPIRLRYPSFATIGSMSQNLKGLISAMLHSSSLPICTDLPPRVFYSGSCRCFDCTFSTASIYSIIPAPLCQGSYHLIIMQFITILCYALGPLCVSNGVPLARRDDSSMGVMASADRFHLRGINAHSRIRKNVWQDGGD